MEWSATVEVTFSVTAGTEETAQKRAEAVKESIVVNHKAAAWLGDIEISEPTVEEA